MTSIWRCAILLAAAPCISLAARAADHVVTPVEGADDEAISAALAKAEPGDRVVLRAGDYRVNRAVRFPRAGGVHAGVAGLRRGLSASTYRAYS